MHCVCVFEVKEVRGGNNDNGKIPHSWCREKTSVPVNMEEGKPKKSEEELKEHFTAQYVTLNLTNVLLIYLTAVCVL